MEAHKPPGPSSGPFYDAEFVAKYQPPPRKYTRKKPMPVTQRTIERWTCDRCGARQEFPDDQGRTALQAGWLKLDLTRSIAQDTGPYLFGKNEQILCPMDVASLRRWFKGEWQ